MPNEYNFGTVPTVNTPRSTFLMHQNIRTTFNAGELIPFYLDQSTMPGDTFKIKGSFVIRQSTPIYPTMDNSFADIIFVRVPIRLVWDHFKEFMGENTTGEWARQTEYEIPKIALNQGENMCVKKGDILNYMGVPLTNGLAYGETKKFYISALPVRAYQLSWNEWFRDENVCPPYNVRKDETTVYPYHGAMSNHWGYYDSNPSSFDPKPAPVFKFKDMFNACLPAPQKGAAISLPLGDTAPVYQTTPEGLKLSGVVNGQWNDDSNLTMAGDTPSRLTVDNGTMGREYGISADNTNLIADLSNAVAATINAQRMAFAAQRILEASARCGTRYVEICQGFFGVQDMQSARLQRPEILGYKRIPITMTQVAQTSSTDTTSPQGNVAAYSLTVDSDEICHFSNTEHAIILGLICVRQEHSYDSGLGRDWTKFKKLDWYWPQLAYIGEQPIYNREIYLAGYDNNDETTDDQVFGYNERFIELRTKQNMNTGAFSTRYAQSLSAWHYGDSYNSLPVLSFEWRKETKAFIDRTLAVTSEVEDQFIMDCRLDMTATRPIPMYGVPSLIDHI